MKMLETHFIPENVAPVGAREIVVMETDSAGDPVREVGTIPLGSLHSGVSSGKRQCRICVFSDVHVYEDNYPTATEDFKRALTYANANCDFTCIAGDLVETGGVEAQLKQYAALVAQYSPDKPVYAIAGNHENYDGYADAWLETYTGHPLFYSFSYGNNVFIMVGHWGAYRGDGIGWRSDEFVSVEELQWLYETLEENRNRRCFVFGHVLPHEHGVGNPNGLYTSALIWKTTDGGVGQAFVNLLRHYKNVLFFHGHSHTRFDLQEIDSKANYSYVTFADGSGYRSIHIPSLAVPRDLTADGSGLEKVFAESEGYVMDVYDDCIVLNGRDFGEYDADAQAYKEPHWLPIATYRIDTTLQEVEAGTFVDETGLIRT